MESSQNTQEGEATQHEDSDRSRRTNTWGSKFFRPSDHTDSWGRRDHSPALDWKKPWTQDTFANGRVLIIDYVSNGNGHNGHISEMHSTSRRKVCATEFENLHSLKTFYSNPDLPQAAFRLIHVQNAGWATELLLEKFNIAHGDELTGTTFAKRVQYERPEQRHGKPFPSGQSWRPTRVRDRNLSYTSYSLDFLRSAVIDNEERALEANKHKGIHDAKIMELNTYHEGSEGAGVDVYVQRFSIHVQLNTPPEEYSPGASSYSRVQTMIHDSPDGTRSANIPGADSRRGSTSSGPMPPTKGSNSSHIAGSTSLAMERSKNDPKYDNTNAIIIFEASPSGDSKDTLIPARNELERRWRRLPFYLKKEEAKDDDSIALECTNITMNDILRALGACWEDFLSASETHVDILQEKIFENPADESRAPEIWANTSMWLKVEKVMWIHQDVIKEMEVHLKGLTEAEPQGGWLQGSSTQFDKLAHSVQEDLVNPTTTLNDLLYKSVGIRDSRHSLQLGTSMWRLSWITFIFLPLTFIVGFFGMNVSTFGGAHNTYLSINYYFLAATILMLLVLFLWYFVKHSLAQRRQTPYQRGLYESLFTALSRQHPSLWTEAGAREGVRPVGVLSGLKWRLLRRWFRPEKTIRAGQRDLDPDADEGSLGAWRRLQRYLLKRWLRQISTSSALPRPSPAALEAGTAIAIPSAAAPGLVAPGGRIRPVQVQDENSVLMELVGMSNVVAVAEGEPPALERVRNLARGLGGGRREESTSSGRESGVMVEEMEFSDEEGKEEGDGKGDEG